jgi:hypothetical protein
MANSRFARIGEHLRYFDYNPVLVKELRQSASSKVVPGTLLLLMGGFILITVLVALVGELRGFGRESPGQSMFEALGLFLVLVSFVFLPVYLYCRTMLEHVAGSADLSFITSLTPQATMAGKSRCAVYMTTLFHCVAWPFFLSCILMQGVYLPVVLATAFFLFALNILLSVGAVSLGLANLDLVPKTLMGLGCGGIAILWCLGMAKDALTGDAVHELLENQLHWWTVCKLAFWALVGYWLLRFCYKSGIRSVHNTNKRDPHPLLRYAVRMKNVDADGNYIGQSSARRGIRLRNGTSAKLYRKPGNRRESNAREPEVPLPAMAPFNKDARKEAAMRLRDALAGSGNVPEGLAGFPLWPGNWDLNPVWVKDFLQAARNPYVTWTLAGLLAVFYLVTIAVALHVGSASLGWEIFQAVSGVATWVSSLFIPVYFFSRTQSERSGSYPDLLYITDLSPQRVIQGKFLSALFLVMLFYSVASPFMVSSYLFKGIDLPTILLGLSQSVLLNLLLAFGAIMLGLVPMPPPSKFLLGAGAWYGAICGADWLEKSGGFPVPSLAEAGYGSAELVQCGLYAVDTVLLAGLLYQASVALVSPKSQNRALPVRKYITSALLLFCGQFLYLSWAVGEPGLATGTIRFAGAFVLAGFLFFACRKETRMGSRLRWQVPKPGLSRLAAFPFFNGKFQGLLWLLALWGAFHSGFIACGVAVESFRPPFPEKTMGYVTLCTGMGTVVLYAFAYTLFAIAFQRLVFKKGPNWVAGVAYLSFLYFPATLPAIPGIYLPTDFLGSAWSALLLSNGTDPESLYPHLATALLLTLVGLAIHYRWIFSRLRAFYRPGDIPMNLSPSPRRVAIVKKITRARLS